MRINLQDRSGLPDTLRDGLITREYEIQGYRRSGIAVIYWWVTANSRADAMAKAKERLAGYDVNIVVK